MATKDEKQKGEKSEILEESTPAIVAALEAAITERTIPSGRIKIPSAKSAQKVADKTNYDTDQQAVRQIAYDIQFAIKNGEYEIRTQYVPISLKDDLEAKGYKIVKRDEYFVIEWKH